MKKAQTKFWVGDDILVGGNLPAIITGVMVNNETVEYRCAYFYEGGYYTCWLCDFEITTNEPTNGQIGYSSGLKAVGGE